MAMNSVKITVLGGGAVGKTAVTSQFCTGIFPTKYDPTIEDCYKKVVKVHGHQYYLEVLDTAGTEQFFAMRDLYIKNGQGFVIVYSITSEATFHEAQSYLGQIAVRKDNVPIVLVGNKCDLVDKRVILTQRGEELAQEWKASFMETSAKLNVNVSEAFMEVTRAVIQKYGIKAHQDQSPRTDKSKCVLS